MSNEKKFEEGVFNPLPDGDYKLRMTLLEARKTKKGDDMMTAKFQIIEGPDGVEGAKNRVIWENFLLTHPNPNAVKAGLGKLSRYAAAVGIKAEDIESIQTGDPTVLSSTLEFPFIATLGKADEYNGKINNTIKAYKAL